MDITAKIETLKTYQVPAQNLDRLTARVGELNKRARRIGCAEIVVREVRRYVRPRKDPHTDMPLPGVPMVEVTVDGVRPVINGWELLAVLSREEGGNLLRKVPRTPELELREWRDALPGCDHCRVNIRRNETFLVRSEASGQVKQVGRNCLADFLGHRDPHALAAMAELLISLDAGEGDDGWGGGGGGEWMGQLVDFLTAASLCIREHGWTSRSKARDLGLSSCTADDALSILTGLQSWNEKVRKEATACWKRASELDRKTAEAALADATERLVDCPDPSSLSDYEHNLKLVVMGDVVKFKTSGLAASLLPWYSRELAKRLQRQTDKDSQHVGTVGERAVFEGLTLRRVFSVETQWGALHIHNFVDEAGNVLVWKTGKKEIEQGWCGPLRATVKKHSEWKGIKQTELTRASEYVAPAPKPAKVPKVKAPAAAAGAPVDDRAAARSEAARKAVATRRARLAAAAGAPTA